MLESRPDLDIELSETASFEEKIEMVATAVKEKMTDLQREQVEVEEEITKVEQAQETLNVVAGGDPWKARAAEEKLTSDTTEYEAEKAENGMNFSFSLAAVGEDIKEPEISTNGPEQETVPVTPVTTTTL